MAHGKIIDLEDAQRFIKQYYDLRDELMDLADGRSPQQDAVDFLKELADHNAFLIDSDLLAQLQKAEFCVVFLARNHGKPTIVIANCNSKDDMVFTVPDSKIAALEHIPPRLIPTVEKGLAGPDKLSFSPQ